MYSTFMVKYTREIPSNNYVVLLPSILLCSLSFLCGSDLFVHIIQKPNKPKGTAGVPFINMH